MTQTFDTLAETAKAELVAKAEAERKVKEAQENERLESFEKMHRLVAITVADDSDLPFEEVFAVLETAEPYQCGTYKDATITVPGVDATKIVVQFNATDPLQDGKLILDLICSRFPFYLSAHAYTHKRPRYKTLGTAIVAARQYQIECDEYQEALEPADYELRKTQEANARNDRVSFLISLINEHPIVLPLLKTLSAYFEREADLESELAEAWNEDDF